MEMAREISLICDFIFRSIRTSLLTDMVDIDLMIWTVKRIYIYRKDHTTEPKIFTPWSKKVIPFPSLRQKIQAFQDKRQEMTVPWNDGSAFQFSAPPKTSRNPTKRTTGKIRTRWSGRNRFNPIKARRHNTPETKVSELDKIDTDIRAPILTKACDRSGLSCSHCEQGAPHPSPQESDWSSKDWDGTKAKAKEETNSLMDYNTPKLQTDIDQKTDVDEIAFSKLESGQSDLKEELVEVTDSLIPPPMTKMPEDTVEKNEQQQTIQSGEETTTGRRKV